jgi:hypothetical protein
MSVTFQIHLPTNKENRVILCWTSFDLSVVFFLNCDAINTLKKARVSDYTELLRSVTEWKSYIICSYPDSKTAFRWFIDTLLTYFFIVCYYIVQENRFRPACSHMNPIQSPWIWNKLVCPKRRNKCPTLPELITKLFIYHRSYRIFARYKVFKQSTSPTSFTRSHLFTFTEFWTQS